MPCCLAATFRDLQAAEDFLLSDAGAVRSVLVRPCALTDSVKTEKLVQKRADDLNVKGSPDNVSRSTVGLAMVALCDERAFEKWEGFPVSVMRER